jgi:copper homeostasis protein
MYPKRRRMQRAIRREVEESVMSGRRILLEVCIASPEDAAAAQAGGADRLELNTALALGGLTPSLGTLAEVRQVTPLPTLAMIRPRPGGFHYGAADFRVMRRDIDLLLAHGADGIAVGVLCEDRRIDGPRCRELVRQAGPRGVIFHRAFDVTPEPFEALEQLIDLGVKRVLTSGQAPTALSGAGLIAELIRRARGRIEVLPGGGVNPATVAEVLARTGCDQVHASLRHRRADLFTRARPHVSFGGTAQAEEGFEATDPAAVAAMRKLLG